MKPLYITGSRITDPILLLMAVLNNINKQKEFIIKHRYSNVIHENNK